MHSLLSLLLLALMSLLVQCQEKSAVDGPKTDGPKIDASTITGTDQFNSIALSLVSKYIPASILPQLGIAVQSAASIASVTGDINFIVSSALTAATPPPFLTSLPSQYQVPVDKIGSTLSSIRGAIQSISLASISSVSSVSSVSAKSVSSVSIASLNGTLQTNSSAILISTTDSSGSGYVTILPATIRNGTKVEITPSTSSTLPASTAATSPPSPSSTSSSGFSVPTHVPLAAAGILGMVGFIAAL